MLKHSLLLESKRVFWSVMEYGFHYSPPSPYPFSAAPAVYFDSLRVAVPKGGGGGYGLYVRLQFVNSSNEANCDHHLEVYLTK